MNSTVFNNMTGSKSSGSTEVDYSGLFDSMRGYSGPDNYVSNPSYNNDYYSYNTSYSSSGIANPVQNINGIKAMIQAERGEDGGGSGLTLSETNTMATVMELTNTFTMSLIKWGVRQATTSWGNSISGLNKFSKVSGKFLGYYSAFAYGMQARNAYNNGDRLHTLSNGLMSFYSLVATKGGTPGLVFTAPFFVIDWTVGMDNFLLYNFNYGFEQSNQIILIMDLSNLIKYKTVIGAFHYGDQAKG